MNGNKQREFGDYQTPCDFTNKVVQYVKAELSFLPRTILEPTCGVGNFLHECSIIFPNSKLIGVEINEDHINNAKKYIHNAELYCKSIFDFNFSNIKMEDLLVIGNPPWAMNSDLSALKSKNIPKKHNLKGLKGFDALTGMSNFDICESVFLKLICAFQNTNTLIALLCKTSVARNVFTELNRKKINTEYIKMLNFDAKSVFNISADACLFVIQLSSENKICKYCEVSSFDMPNNKEMNIEYTPNGILKIMGDNTANFDGKCSLEWRQGIKHDCSKIMELTKIDGKYINGLNEIVDIEEDLIFPLVKSSHIKSNILDVKAISKYVIVPQKHIKEDTKYIKQTLPKTWKYLNKHKSYFDNRKSSIYKNSFDFGIFGIGDYSFSKYKVCISGFYKKPRFSLLASNTPIMLDDTCYFVGFDNYYDAYITMELLNNPIVQNFIQRISFVDSKRPFTKKILSRIDINKIINNISLKEMKTTDIPITPQMFRSYSENILKLNTPTLF